MERRGNFRVRRHVLIRVKPGEADEHVALVVNVSPGGIAAVSRTAYEAGTPLRLSFPPSELGPPKEVQARVIRSRPLAEAEGFELAMEFVQSEASDERRRLPRLRIRSATLYRLEGEGEDRGALLEDLSAGGVGLAVKRDLPPGSRIRVAIPETELGPARVETAEVRWTGPHDKPPMRRLGAEFMG